MLNIFFLPCPFVLPLSLIQLAYTFVFAVRRSLSQFTYHLLQWNPVNLCCTWCSTSVTSVVATGVRNVRLALGSDLGGLGTLVWALLWMAQAVPISSPALLWTISHHSF